MPPFPTTPQKIKERIMRYEAALRQEKKRFGAIDDSFGKRYLLGPLYLLAGDIPGAVKAFAWFEKHFPNDAGEPFHRLCWSQALFQSGALDKAAKKLGEAMLANLYLLPFLLKIDPPPLDFWHGSNWDERDYIAHGPLELLRLWDPQALAWALECYQSDAFSRLRLRYIEISILLENEPVGPKRSALVRERSALRHP